MPPTPGGDQPYLKHLNRARVLHLLRTHPGLSRAELAAHSGLTKVTVGSLVTTLLDSGWLSEGHTRPGATGRPGRELHLGETRHVLLGAEIGVLGARAVATTLRGSVLARAETRTPTTTPHAATQTITQLCQHLLRDPATQGRELLGLGVALPGPVSPDGTRVLYAPNLGWDDVPFLDLLRAAPDLPPLPTEAITLDNEANAAAFGESFLRPGEPPQLLAYVSLGSGVGAGFTALSGTPHVLRGARGLAGEIGHAIIQPGGLYCHCGNRGCVETLLGGWAIRAALNLNVLDPLDEALAPRLREAAVQVTLGRAGEALGQLLVNLHQTLGPDEIVIGGALTRLDGAVLGPALDVYHARQWRPAAPPARITVRQDSLYLPALGAAAQVLARVIDTPQEPA
ncbi:ROK family protein [Deinococcus sp. RM]|uniref:ROK family protein n=1 Tax=Deinococcus sp. RM TaxID=2316359 RepID=UPI000E67F8B7|nr:ROK family protein [Deinococcus sp. RM]RIY09378.1 ROK family protein [Deinococcus sp. RM]